MKKQNNFAQALVRNGLLSHENFQEINSGLNENLKTKLKLQLQQS